MAENLLQLITSGKLRGGTTLHHHGRQHALRAVTATVVANGISFGGRTYSSPSAAAKAITGRPVDGWIFWKLPTGEQLGSLRSGG
jgi:hypothetical protein